MHATANSMRHDTYIDSIFYYFCCCWGGGGGGGGVGVRGGYKGRGNSVPRIYYDFQ